MGCIIGLLSSHFPVSQPTRRVTKQESAGNDAGLYYQATAWEGARGGEGKGERAGAAVSGCDAGQSQAMAMPWQWGTVYLLLSDSSFRLRKEGPPEQERSRAR